MSKGDKKVEDMEKDVTSNRDRIIVLIACISIIIFHNTYYSEIMTNPYMIFVSSLMFICAIYQLVVLLKMLLKKKP